MEIDFDALISRTKLALQESKTETYLEPFRVTYHYQFLSDTSIHKSNLEVMLHTYYPEFNLKGPVGGWYVIHGHRVDISCVAPAFCHQFGYWPTKEFSPRFIKQFNIKWREIYLEKGWKING